MCRLVVVQIYICLLVIVVQMFVVITCGCLVLYVLEGSVTRHY